METSFLKKYELGEEEGYYAFPDEDTECNESLDEICGREYEKWILQAGITEKDFNDLLSINNYSIFLLTAPYGYGKTYLAECYAQTLVQNGYKIHQIDCEAFMKEDAPDALLENVLAELAEKTAPNNPHKKKMYVHMKKFSCLAEDEKCEKVLLNFFRQLDMYDCNCIFLATEENVSSIPVSVLRSMEIIELGLPDLSERRTFFADYFGVRVFNPLNEDEYVDIYPLNISAKEKENGKIDIDDDVITLYCAEETDGLSFGELTQVIKLLSKILKTKLIEATNGDYEDGLYSVVTHSKKYCIEETEFKMVVSKVKKNGAFTCGRANLAQSAMQQTAPVMTQPQIVYAMPPGMSAYQAADSKQTSSTPSVLSTNFQIREQLLADATSENASVKSVNDAYAMAVAESAVSEQTMNDYLGNENDI